MRLLLLMTLVTAVTAASVHPREITALTLRSNVLTISLRDEPRLQLQCIGDVRRCSYAPPMIQCQNVGWDGQQVQWKCESYPPDGSILVGSCTYHYTLRGNPPATIGEVIAIIFIILITALLCM